MAGATDTPTDMQAVIDAARQGVAPSNVFVAGSARAIYLPNYNGGDGKLFSLEDYEARPYRKRGTVTVFDVASFNQVIRDNAGAGDVSIYVDRHPERPVVEAVLNGNGKGGPGWSDFRVRIAARPTPQWQKWKGIDGKLLDQTQFAEFIEENLADISDPPGAEMLEVATAFQVARNTSFRRATRLSDGNVQLEHVENTEAKVGPGAISVPETITLGLAPLYGAPVYKVPARFRYRLTDGKLTLGIKMQRLEDIMADVLEQVVAAIERSTDVSVLEGQAPT